MQQRLSIAFDPLAALARLEDCEGLSFLHSAMREYGLGRYSILACEPSCRLLAQGGRVRVIEGGVERAQSPDFLTAIQQCLRPGLAPREGLPFQGGAIGYFSYEGGRRFEPGSFTAREDSGPDARFFFYDAAVVFDHEKRATFLVARDERGRQRWPALKARLESDLRLPREDFELVGGLRSNFQRQEYLARVSEIRKRIRSGEVYQVNLSQRFEGACRGSPRELFRRLALENPAPYAAYVNFGDEQIVSASPERFLKVENKLATTRPIKGTRPATGDRKETDRHAAELAASEKDQSELLMIVDLERNDLGRVCEAGSVRVDGLFGLERYPTVIHQTANVSGVLETGRSAFDCVRAMFPGGSITGAPKIQAMRVIEELERGPRRVYTGSIGYFDAAGRCELNVAIRSFRVAADRVSFQVGGGIVWDSEPESEYEETLVKARAMRRALGVDE